MLEWLIQIDKDVFLFLNGFHNSFFDILMYWVSNKYIWIPLYAFFLFLIIKRYKWKALLVIIFAALLVTLTDQISVQLFKNNFMRLRPCHEPTMDGLVHVVNNKCGGPYGFISSHAANTFAIATYLSYILAHSFRYFSVALFLWATLVAYSRIYLGVHYPGDVIIGAMLGVILGAIFSKIFFTVLSTHWKTKN